MAVVYEQKCNVVCKHCKPEQSACLCQRTTAVETAFAHIKVSYRYPAGSILFLEKEAPLGLFIVCSGQVKLSVNLQGGKTLIRKIAKRGEIIGLSSTMQGTPYEVSAETLDPAEIAFIRRNDFLGFIARFPEVFETREQIATRLGFSREAVTPVLNDFRNERCVTAKEISAMIPDQPALWALYGD